MRIESTKRSGSNKKDKKILLTGDNYNMLTNNLEAEARIPHGQNFHAGLKCTATLVLLVLRDAKAFSENIMI
jgi:hypothetical protein